MRVHHLGLSDQIIILRHLVVRGLRGLLVCIIHVVIPTIHLLLLIGRILLFLNHGVSWNDGETDRNGFLLLIIVHFIIYNIKRYII